MMVAFKIPPVRIASDDCEIHVGREIVDGEIVRPGTAYRVHEGEWVEIIPATTIRAMLGFSPPDDDGEERDLRARMRRVEQNFEDIAYSLSRRVVAWNWTDLAGEPLPSPYRNPEIIKDLHVDEIVWLMGALSREPGDDRKNGFSASPAISTTATRRRARSSSGASASGSAAPPAKR